MGCSTSKSAAASMPAGNSSSSSSESRRFRPVMKKFGKSHSFAPLIRSGRHESSNSMRSDYHVVALTSSTYGIMKLVEAENMSPESSNIMYSKMRKSESMPARSCCRASKTWIDMAMGISRMHTAIGSDFRKELHDEEEVESAKKPLRDKRSSDGEELNLWEGLEVEPETINTWELMAGIEDFCTPRPSPALPLPLAECTRVSADSRQNLQESKKLGKPRSRSLSSIGGQKVAAAPEVTTVWNRVELPAAAHGTTTTTREKDAGRTSPSTTDSSSSWTLFSNFCTPSPAEEEDCSLVVDDSTASLFDPDILASFAASSIDGRTESGSRESDEWCRDAMTSTSGAASLADEDHLTTFQWSTTRSETAGACQEAEKQIFRSSSLSPDTAAARSEPWKLSFAKIAPEASEVDHAATDSDHTAMIQLEELSRRATTDQLSSSSRLSCSKKTVTSGLEAYDRKCPPGGNERLVLYTTSLRGIRKTYEDCNKVRMILQSYLVWIDERDVSMHAEFRQELKELLMDSAPPVQVPRVFIMGHYIGGVEEVLELHEDSKLALLLLPLPPPQHPMGQLPLQQQPGTRRSSSCDGCGGLRFIPCPHCNGSCKLITSQRFISRCLHCNENGLKRCPICF